jgi:riboflavin synthase alpha subunit
MAMRSRCFHPAHAEGDDLGGRNAGDTVNIEVDQMARYAARLMEAGG